MTIHIVDHPLVHGLVKHARYYWLLLARKVASGQFDCNVNPLTVSGA